jgi:hypothetical protein
MNIAGNVPVGVQHFGKRTIRQLRQSLERLVDDPQHESSPLYRCLKAYPDNWRSSTPQLRVLPQFPMVLHRGGYPDGS